MIKFDFHSHTNYQDGLATPSEMIAGAVKKGLKVFGISEHAPRLPEFRYRDDPPGEVRGLARWPEYLAEMEELKIKHVCEIELLKGCEIDWVGTTHRAYYEKLLGEGKFDYTIGSVHFLGTWGFDYIGDWKRGYKDFESLGEIYRLYYAEYTQMVKSGLFDIAGHLDLIKKFNDEYELPEDEDELALAAPALDVLAKSQMVLEISSAGLVKPCHEFYPSLALLKSAREREIPITFNSDAHSPERIAESFETAVEFAREAGYESAVIFHRNGEREEVKF